MWDLIVSVPDHCLSFYFLLQSCPINCATLTLRRMLNSGTAPRHDDDSYAAETPVSRLTFISSFLSRLEEAA